MKQIGLGHLRWAFEKNDVDGPLLSALAHHHFGAVMLETMGFSISEQEVLVSGIKSYHHVQVTTTLKVFVTIHLMFRL